ncbi:MAG: YihY/virulence factor BrkB family protein [Bacteroidetes bacterium]|nr:YihY/virulence factor BrkB family protein [Bacteroidota bacterium]
MSKIKLLIDKILLFIRHDIWFNRFTSASPFFKWLIKEIKVILYTLTNYERHNIAVRSSALAFYTALSIVPLAAMISGIMSGFGITQSIIEYIKLEIPQYTEIIDQVIEISNSYIKNYQKGIFTGIVVVIVFWAVLKVFINIEKAFNHVWEVRRGRSLSRKVSDYLMILFTTPVIFVLYKSGRSELTEVLYQLSNGSDFLYHLLNIAIALGTYIVTAVIFMIIYGVFPNTKVKFSSALHSSLFISLIYLGFQEFYIYFQTSLSSYNVIYGSFAAIPLFLLWIHITWQIVLFGSELSFAYQNIKQYEFERESEKMSDFYRMKITIMTMSLIAKNFISNDKPFSPEELSNKMNVPLALINESLYKLEESDFIISIDKKENREYSILPTKDVTNLKIMDIFKSVQHNGQNDFIETENRIAENINNILISFENSVTDSPENIKLLDLKCNIL